MAGAGALAASTGLSAAPPTVGIGTPAPTTTGTVEVTVGRPSSTVAALTETTSSTTPATPPPSTVATSAVGDTFAAFDESLQSSLIGRGALAVSVAVAKDGFLSTPPRSVWPTRPQERP